MLLWRISTTNRDVFSFLKLWSLYPATLGQAIPSAFGQLRLALTILESLWKRRNGLLGAQYNKEKKQFLNLFKHELHKLDGILDCADEINLILQEMGSKYRVGELEFEQDVIESYFKVIKLRLTFTPGKDYCRIKLRTLIGSFGYKRRTAALVEYINRTINSLGLKTFLRGWEQL